MPLTEQQLSALPHVEWLVSTEEYSRRTGRSFLMAVAIVRNACRNPRSQVYVFDHILSDNRRYMLGLVSSLAHSDPLISPHVRITNDRYLRIDLEVPILDWMPPETVFSRPYQGPLPRGLDPEIPTFLERLLSEDIL